MIDELDDIPTFAKRIKTKFPEYKDLDDGELVERIVRKHPVYADKVRLPEGFSIRGTTTSGYPNLDALYEKVAKEYNVPADLLIEQARQETSFSPEVFYGKRASSAGAVGAGQFMPGTAPTYGVKDRTNPIQSITGQAKYMRKLLDQFDNNEELALAGYNAGEHRKALAQGRVPKIKETQDYVKIITGHLRKARAQGFTLKGHASQPTFPNQQQPLSTGIEKPLLQPGQPLGEFPEPVPESPNTLAVQAGSMDDPKSPKAAVLVTPGEIPPTVDPATHQVFPVKDGQLIVNLAKAKKLKLRNPEDIQLFLDNNRDALTRLLGKVENVGDATNTGPVVAAMMPDGTEASASIVTTPETAQEQVALDQQAYPGSKPVITDAPTIAAQRQAQNQGGGSVGAEKPSMRPQVNAAALPPQTQAPATRPPVVPPDVVQEIRQVADQLKEEVVGEPAVATAEPLPARTAEATEGRIIDDSFKRAVTFREKPADVDNEEWVIQNLVPEIVSKTGYDAIDVEKQLREGFTNTYGTPLPDIGKDGSWTFEMTPEFADAVAMRAGQREDVSRRTAAADADFEQRRATLPTDLAGADRDLEEFRLRGLADVDAGLVTPEQAVAAHEKLAKDIETWRNDRGFLGIWNQEEWAKVQNALTAGGRKYSETAEGITFDKPQPQTDQQAVDKAYADMRKQYGSVDNWVKATKEYKERFEKSPMTFLFKTGESAVGGAMQVPFQGAAAALETIAIASEAIERGTGGLPGDAEDPSAEKKATYKLGNDIRKLAEGLSVDKDFKGGYAELAGNVFGQVVVQTGLAIATGGAAAPALFGGAMGASEAYRNAGEMKDATGRLIATPWQRLGGAFVGAALAAPEYFIFKSMLKAGNAIEKASILQNFKATVERGLVSKGVAGPLAEKAAVATVDGFLKQMIAKGGWRETVGKIAQVAGEKSKFGLMEGVQEPSESTGNDIFAYLTYDPSPERLEKAFAISGEKLVEGVAGFFGGITGATLVDLNARAAGLSPEALEQTDALLADMKAFLPPKTYEAAKKSIENALNVEPQAGPDKSRKEPVEIPLTSPPGATTAQKPFIPPKPTDETKPEIPTQPAPLPEKPVVSDEKPARTPPSIIDIADEIEIDSSRVKEHIDRYGINGEKTDGKFESVMDKALNLAISEIYEGKETEPYGAEFDATPGAKEPWEQTRESFVGEGYTFQQTDRALRMELNRWKKIQAEASGKNVSIEAVERSIAKTQRKIDLAKAHRESIERALTEGKPVPAKILADYPDLKAQVTDKTETSETPKTETPATTEKPADEVQKPVAPKSITEPYKVTIRKADGIGMSKKPVTIEGTVVGEELDGEGGRLLDVRWTDAKGNTRGTLARPDEVTASTETLAPEKPTSPVRERAKKGATALFPKPAAKAAESQPAATENKSDAEIKRWTEILQKDTKNGLDRLRKYLASQTLGKDFGEKPDDYFARTGKTDFVAWATPIARGEQPVPAAEQKPATPKAFEPATLDFSSSGFRLFKKKQNQARLRKQGFEFRVGSGKRQVRLIKAPDGYNAGDFEMKVYETDNQRSSERKVGTSKPKPGKPQSLSQFVRSSGGIKSNRYQKGEVNRISNKETGTTGLVNQKTGKDPEAMAAAAWELGYLRDRWETAQDVNGDELMQAVEDDVRGIHKYYPVGTNEDVDVETGRTIEEQELLESAKRYKDEDMAVRLALLTENELGHHDKISDWLGDEEVMLRLAEAEIAGEINPTFRKKIVRIGVQQYDIQRSTIENAIDLIVRTAVKARQRAIAEAERQGTEFEGDRPGDTAGETSSVYDEETLAEARSITEEPELDEADTSFNFGENVKPSQPATAFDQVDLFGNKTTPQVAQPSMFAAPEETPKADPISQAIADLKSKKGNEAIIQDANDALEIFRKAQRTKAPVADMLRQQNLEGKTVEESLSPRAVQFVEAMDAGTFPAVLTKEIVKDQRKAETGYHSGDKIEYTGEPAPEGFRDFVYLEGHKKGEHGVERLPEAREADVAKTQKDFKEQQEAFKRLRENEPLRSIPSTDSALKRWAGDTKVVDDKGNPLMVFTGHSNIELYGDRYNPKKGIAGGFYATEDPTISSGYAIHKVNGSYEEHTEGSQYRFKQKNGKFGKKIWQIQLTLDQQQIAREHISELGYDVEEYWKDNRMYDREARMAVARGGLRDLQSIFNFLENMGENIWYRDHQDPRPNFEKQQFSEFENLLNKLGLDWQSADREQPGTMPVYLKIENPLDASKPFPPDLLKALQKKASRVRDPKWASDLSAVWTKDYSVRDWVDDIAKGDEYWTTHVPAKAIEIIKSFGYDGIKEVGNKTEADRSKRQINWIAFEPTQIKSAIGNKGTFDPNDPSILRKVRTPETVDELTKLTEATDFSAVVPKIETSTDGNVLNLESPEAAEVARTLLAFAQDTDRKTQPVLEGLFLDPANVAKLTDAAEGFADAAEENGVDAKLVRDLIANIAKAAEKNGTVKLNVFDDALAHEDVHEATFLGSEGKKFEQRYANARALKKDATFQKFHKALNRVEKQTVSHGVAMEEALAYLTNGDHARFGLTEEEGTEIVAKLVEGYAQANGVESLKYFDNTKAYEAIETYRKSLSREGGNESRSGLDSGRKTGPSETEGQPAPSDTGERRETPAQRTKNRRFSESLAKHLLEIGDVPYDPQTMDGWVKSAFDTVEEQGVDGAIEAYRKMPANTSEGRKTALGIAIAQTLKDEGRTGDYRLFGKELTENIGNVAQELKAASILSRLDPDYAPIHGDKITQRNHGRPQTPQEYSETERRAQELADVSNQRALIEAALTEAEERVANLETQVKDLEGVLQSEKAKAAKAGDLAKALASAKASASYYKGLLEEKRKTRTYKPKTRKDLENLRASIKANRSDYLKLIKDTFGANEIVRMVAQQDALNDTLRAVPETTLDPDVQNALVGLSAEKLINDVPTLTPTQFGDWLDKISNGKLTEHQKAVVHALAWNEITPEKSVSPEAKAAMRNRLAHAQMANVILNADAIVQNKANKEALKTREAFRYDKFARVMVDTAKTLDVSEEAVFTAAMIREHRDLHAVREAFRAEYPDGNFDKVSVEAKNLLDATRSSIEKALYESRYSIKDISAKEIQRLKVNEKEARSQQRIKYQALERHFRQLERPAWQKGGAKVLDAWNMVRAVMFSTDAGFALAQGGPLLATHPTLWAKSLAGITPALEAPGLNRALTKAGILEDGDRIAQNVRRRFPGLDRSLTKLGITGEKFDHAVTRLWQTEARKRSEALGAKYEQLGALQDWNEGIMSKLSEKIPVVRQSNLAHSLATDLFRLNLSQKYLDWTERMYDQGKLTAFERNRAEEFLMKKWVNVMTGKGYLGYLEPSAWAAAQVMSAPRYTTSSFQLIYYMNPLRIAALPKGARSIVAQESAKMWTAASVPLLILGMLGLVNLDPEDKEFLSLDVGKLFPKYKDLKINPIRAFKEPLRLTFGMGIKAAIYKARGNEDAVKRIQRQWYNELVATPFGGIGTFWRSKAHPAISLISTNVIGENFVGEPAGWTDRLPLPLTVSEAVESATYDRKESILKSGKAGKDRDWERALLAVIANGIGLGANSYPGAETTVAGKQAQSMMTGDPRSDEEREKSKIANQLERAVREGLDVTEELASAIADNKITESQAKHLQAIIKDELGNFESKFKVKLTAEERAMLLNHRRAFKILDYLWGQGFQIDRRKVETVMKFATKAENTLNDRAAQAEAEAIILRTLLRSKKTSKR